MFFQSGLNETEKICIRTLLILWIPRLMVNRDNLANLPDALCITDRKILLSFFFTEPSNLFVAKVVLILLLNF